MAKTEITAREYNIRMWKVENGWKVTTTEINGKNRDVTSKLRSDLLAASRIAQAFLEAREMDDIVVSAQMDMFDYERTDAENAAAEEAVKGPQPTEAEIARELGLPVDELTETPEAIVDQINTSMLAGDRKRGFKG